jgi:regulator of protease activity HflC (stomatin/prohibitin superfamily)
MFLLRSKLGALRIRDKATGEMQVVTSRAWVPFEMLPTGMEPKDYHDVEIRIASCDEDLKAADAENQRMDAEDKARIEARALRDKARDEKAAEALAAKEAAIVARGLSRGPVEKPQVVVEQPRQRRRGR